MYFVFIYSTCKNKVCDNVNCKKDEKCMSTKDVIRFLQMSQIYCHKFLTLSVKHYCFSRWSLMKDVY